MRTIISHHQKAESSESSERPESCRVEESAFLERNVGGREVFSNLDMSRSAIGIIKASNRLEACMQARPRHAGG
jgi:hypothetical protein